MRDVLEVLAKLPPSCLVWESGQGYIIHRGVAGRHEYPVASEMAVVLWNYEHNVSPEQVAAMQAGSQFGWESAGADLAVPQGNTTYVYSAPLQVMLSVNANHEEDAAKVAAQSLEKFVEYMQGTSQDHVITVVRDGKLDLIEEQKHDN